MPSDPAAGPPRHPTPVQVKAARLLLGWSRDRLASRSGLPVQALSLFEHGGSGPAVTAERLDAIRAALEAAGVEFTDGERPGVRLRRADT